MLYYNNIHPSIAAHSGGRLTMKKHTLVLSIALILFTSIFVVGCSKSSDPIKPGDTAHLPDYRWTFNLNPDCYDVAVHLQFGGTITILGELEEGLLLAKYEWPDNSSPLPEDDECGEILIGVYEILFRHMEDRYQAKLAEIQEREELRKKIVKMLEEN